MAAPLVLRLLVALAAAALLRAQKRSPNPTATRTRNPSASANPTPSRTPTPMPPASFVAGCPGAPTVGSSWTPVGGGPSTTNNVYTTWTSLPANLGSTRLLTSSPEGKSAFAFGNSSATPATLFSWNRAEQEWLELDTPGVGLSSVGLPAGAVKVYLVDVAVTGVIWLSLVDTVGATRFFSSQPSRDQLLSTASVSTVPAFVESPAAACGS